MYIGVQATPRNGTVRDFRELKGGLDAIQPFRELAHAGYVHFRTRADLGTFGTRENADRIREIQDRIRAYLKEQNAAAYFDVTVGPE